MENKYNPYPQSFSHREKGARKEYYSIESPLLWERGRGEGLIIILFCFLMFTYPSHSFESLLIKPPEAAVFEPRCGSLFEFKDKKLRLDIGTSIDLFEIKNQDDQQMRLGSDFFTYTRLRSEGNMKFPVETSDYYFGLNYSYKFEFLRHKTSVRLRLAHISSHLVDGMATGDSLFTRKSYVFSREFTDLIGFMEFGSGAGSIRCYAGFQYVFLTKPKDPDPIIPQIGFDFEYPLNSFLKLRGGHDFRLLGISSIYAAQNNTQAGIYIQTSKSVGLLLAGYYNSGRSIHGMFFREYDNYFGLGFQLCFN